MSEDVIDYNTDGAGMSEAEILAKLNEINQRIAELIKAEENMNN